MNVVRGLIDLGNISFSEGLKQVICSVFFLLLDLFCQKIEQFTESPVIHVHGVADLKSAFLETYNSQMKF